MNKFLLILFVHFFFYGQLLCQNGEVNLVLPSGHTSAILGVDYAASGKYVLSFGRDKIVKVYDDLTGFEIATFSASNDQILEVVFLTNEELVAIVDANFFLSIWNWKNQTIHHRQKLESIVTSVLVYDKGTLLMGAMNGVVYEYDWRKKKIKKQTQTGYQSISAMARVTKGDMLIGNWEGDFGIWNIKKMQKQYDFPPSKSEIKSIASTPDGNYFYVSDETKVTKWDFKNRQKIQVLDEPFRQSYNSLKCTSDGKYLLGAADDFNTYAWKISPEKDKLHQVFYGHQNWVTDVAISPISSRIVTSSWDETLFYWEVGLENPLRQNRRWIDEIVSMDLDKKGRELLVGTKEGDVRIIDLSTGRQQTVYNIHSSWVNEITFSKDQNFLLSASIDNSAKLVKIGNLDSTRTIKIQETNGISNIVFTDPNNSKVAFSSGNKIFQGDFLKGDSQQFGKSFQEEITDLKFISSRKLFVILSGKKAFLVNEFAEKIDSLQANQYLSQAEISPDEKSILIASWDKKIYQWDLQKNKIQKFVGHQEKVTALAFHADGEQFISGDAQGEIFLWNLGKERFLQRHEAHTKKITNLLFHEKQIISTAEDYKLKIWAPQSFKEIATYIPFQEEQFLTILPSNFYSASNQRTLFENAGFQIGGELYPLIYIDPQLNRPHEVLQKMPRPNPLLKNKFESAFHQRLELLGISESENIQIILPKVYMENFEKLDVTTNKKTQTLDLVIEDEKHNITQISIFNNDVLYQRTNVETPSLTVEKEVSIKLVKGKNSLKVFATNAVGSRSFPKIIQIDCSAGKEKPNLYLLVIGVSKMANEKFNLGFATKDAKDILAGFQMENEYYDSIYTESLFDTLVTKESLTKSFDFFNDIKTDDIALIFYEGHGFWYDSKFYLSTFHSSPSDTSNVNSFLFEDFEKQLVDIATNKKLVILDASYSGKNNNYFDQAKTSNTHTNFRATTESEIFRGVLKGNSLLLELFFELDINGHGIPILAGTGANEKGSEDHRLKNGILTYFLKKAIFEKEADHNNDGRINMQELLPYLQKKVREQTDEKQTPNWRSRNHLLDFRIW